MELLRDVREVNAALRAADEGVQGADVKVMDAPLLPFPGFKACQNCQNRSAEDHQT